MIIKDRKKLITFEADVLQVLEAYSRRTGSSLRTILSEAAREWLKKKGQPVGLPLVSRRYQQRISENVVQALWKKSWRVRCQDSPVATHPYG